MGGEQGARRGEEEKKRIGEMFFMRVIGIFRVIYLLYAK